MKTHLIYFSPKNGTFKCADALADGLGNQKVYADITLPSGRETPCNISDDSIVVFAAPVFGGHPQAFFKEYIKGIKGNNTPAILLAVYGNRDYDMTFREMYDIVTENGFYVISAVAAVAEHSFNNDIQTGRPDKNDLFTLQSFGRQIAEKLETNTYKVFGCDDIPQKPVNIGMIGMHGVRLRGLAPNRPIVSENCIGCGRCSQVCPAGIIGKGDPPQIADGCIFCRACARICPVKAIEFTQKDFGIVASDCMEHFGKDLHAPEIWL